MDKDKKNQDTRVQPPADITSLTEEQLAQLEADATAEFDTLVDSNEGDPDARLTRVTELADIIDSARVETGRRADLAAERQAKIDEQVARVRPDEGEGESGGNAVDGDVVEGEVAEAVPAVVATGGATVGVQGVRPNGVAETLISGRPMPTAKRKLNPNLGDMRRNTPPTVAPRRRESVLLASAEIPGIAQGSSLGDMDALVAAMMARAKTLPVTTRGLEAPWYPVASLQLDHRYMLDMNASPQEINDVLTAATDPEAMVAAGGWCSPSEISYDFYNIVCEDGMLDLPSAGINRGGMRWPTSASYGDIVNNFWTWNETQDIAALTGTAQSGTKTCFRVPCPGMNEQRLRCDGFCLTVGNLMEDAWPELIANHTRLTFAGHAHRLNTLRINSLLDPSMSVAVTGYGSAGQGLVAPVLGSLELTAIDMREKYRMCEDAVLEVVLPRWLRGAMRADLRKRGGVDLLEVADARLMNMFDLINVRVQWVTDWQVGISGLPGGSTPLVTWPTTVQFLMFPAGTFLWGRGFQLNLGVVRDSVLNATNDHTAEWMEECWLMAKIGHESRLGTIPICADGTTGAMDLTACSP